jgi:hypothetical protein
MLQHRAVRVCGSSSLKRLPCSFWFSPLSVVPSVVTIVIQEYHIPFPPIMDSLTSAFSWANLSVFQLVQTGCKVCRTTPVALCCLLHACYYCLHVTKYGVVASSYYYLVATCRVSCGDCD